MPPYLRSTRDAQGSRLTHLKVTGGVLKARNLLSGHKQNKAEDIWEEKVNQIRIYSGAKFEMLKEARGRNRLCSYRSYRNISGRGTWH